MNHRAMQMNEIWQIRVRPVCYGCRRIIQTTRHTFIIIRLNDCFQSTVVSATEISCQLTRMETFKSGSDPESRNNSATNAALQALPSRPHQILTPLRP